MVLTVIHLYKREVKEMPVSVDYNFIDWYKPYKQKLLSYNTQIQGQHLHLCTSIELKELY